MKSVMKNSVRNILLLILSVFAISACTTSKSTKGIAANAFDISFNKKGELIVHGPDGKRVKPLDKYEEKGRVIKRAKMNLSLVKGSCYYILKFNGKIYKISIPTEYCH
jgi:uncharacterized lipoprotein YajG